MKRWLLAVLLLAAGPVVAMCFDTAGQRHAIDPALLQAIAEVESAMRANAVNVNADGSRDVGLMQINSYHFPRLARQGITEARLLSDSCLAVEVGAGILRGFIQRYGYNWTAVGAYNAGGGAGREAARRRYARKVWQRYQALLEQRPALSAATR
ncbi:lytic transglycosylase domain-containing protein [Pseudomonas typographi]|uniref:Lytic transglycosylase domain-containing protein n=1 Tax=Pseudomonas typographi TaxID=2715964 RepID=A0ABR7Z285_9PSED|nr:lytic transglycosylase domain-containing protein [Pseudomonas typographi]MBD1552399.1 lytic transglycosylase domain-containing protein [Pseudomonas typographi]MBD1587206.1 lytic transglycosylase domain-containing protein [Pseudomonas typographi]MBD1599519.1 lytic transglycosylase domain-containing protein [Pseudomonas typographi]